MKGKVKERKKDPASFNLSCSFRLQILSASVDELTCRFMPYLLALEEYVQAFNYAGLLIPGTESTLCTQT